MEKNTIKLIHRNIGIELLRVYSMYMIIILHILSIGGILKNNTILSIKYESTWLLEILCYCAVNCYAIITGYVMCMSRVKYYKIILLWIQVELYSIIITILLTLFTDLDIGVRNYIKAFTPILSQQYWYFTAYFGMFLIVPCLNLVVEYMNKRHFQILLLNLGIWFSVLPVLRQVDTFKILRGYHMVWLMIMYMVGAYIRKYVNIHNVSKIKAFSVYLVACIGTWANKWAIEKLTLKIFGEIRYGEIFIQYISPTIVVAAIGLFLFFLKIDVNHKMGNKIIKILAPVSFSVYLIHAHPLVYEYILQDRFIGFLKYSPLVMIVAVMLTALLIYLFCTVIDYVRIAIFNFLRIEEKCTNLVDWVKMKFALE